MQEEIPEVETATFHLVLPFNEVVSQYPSLAQSWIDKRRKLILLQKNQMENHLHAQLIFSYKPKLEQTIGYKIIKQQRLLVMLTRLSRKLPAFDPVEEALKVQNTSPKPKKDADKEVQYDDKQSIKSFYLQKGESIFAKMVKTYNNAVGILKLNTSQKVEVSIKQFILNKISCIKTAFNTKEPLQQSSLIKQNVQTTIISTISTVGSILSQTLHQMMKNLSIEAQNDGMIDDFLTGKHKFYKIDSLDFQKYFNYTRYSKTQTKWADFLESAGKLLFDYSLVEKQTSQRKDNIESDLSNIEQLELKIGWNWSEVQKTSNYLQTIFNYTNGKFRDHEGKILMNPVVKQERTQQVIHIFCRVLKKQLLFLYYGELNSLLEDQYWVEMETKIGMQKSQILLNKKKDEQKKPKQKNLSFLIEEEYVSNCLNKSIDEIQQELCQPSKKQFHIHPVESRQLLSQFYHHQVVTLYSFIECEKTWFFRNHKVKDDNVDDRYRIMLKWIPLTQDQNFGQNLLTDFNSFAGYVGSLVYSFLQVKDGNRLSEELEQMKKGNQASEQQISNFEESHSLQKFFLYNDMDNLLTYKNMSFENITQCHYYLKYIKNDTRAEFDDRSWTQYLNEEVIRLVRKRKLKNDIKYSDIQVSEGQIVSMITIPVRGRFCRHLDFFDLRDVYGQIFPQPYCSPESILCPKCLVDIPFEQLIYLKEVEILLQLIKIFYLQEEQGLDKHLTMSNQVISKNGYFNQTVSNIKTKDKFILKDLKLTLNHPNQSAKISGKYIFKVVESPQLENQHKTKIQTQNQNQNQILFQWKLDKEIYQTLLNPNKNFKSTKKLKKFLKNFGRSKFTQSQCYQDQEDETSQRNTLLNFEQRIQTAKASIQNRWKLYKDLQKGTISI